MIRLHLHISILAITLALQAAAGDDGNLLGPIWGGDDTTDAGSTPATAQKGASISAGTNGSPLGKVVGATLGSSLVGADHVDVYELTITAPNSLSITTQNTPWDTMLYLFKKVVEADGTIWAKPVVANDDISTGVYWSKIQQTQLPTGGYAIPNLTAGEYFVAVTNYPRKALACTRGGSAEMFTFQGSTGLSFPASNPTLPEHGLCDWTVSTATTGGAYDLNLPGGGFVVVAPLGCEDAPLLAPNGPAPFAAVPQLIPFHTVGLESSCGTPGSISAPQWVRLQPCHGTAIINLIPSSSTASPYRFVVFEGVCGQLVPVACGIPSGIASSLTLNADGCHEYIVAFGPLTAAGANPSSTAYSAGILDYRCDPRSPADIDGDGSVGASDLALLLAQWGGPS